METREELFIPEQRTIQNRLVTCRRNDDAVGIREVRALLERRMDALTSGEGVVEEYRGSNWKGAIDRIASNDRVAVTERIRALRRAYTFSEAV